MTRHLYYGDSYLTRFSGKIIERLELAGKPAVVLDQTAFYPASGGQPCDTGTLEGVRVESVEEDDSGRILHVLDSMPSPEIVSGIIDWRRRFDHMQQHTGQHILSQAFLHVAKAGTLAFHLGLEISTIDIDLASPEPAVMAAAEDVSARVIFEDRPVHVLEVSREELSALGVRKESRREGRIRVIEIEDFDRSPCGGTHVRHCGEIGLIFILGSERYKGGTRVEFVCGGRALHAFRKDHSVLKDLGRTFSAHPHELPQLAEKFLRDRAALQRENRRLHDRTLEMEARELVQGAEMKDGTAVVCRTYPDLGIEELKALAQKIISTPGRLAILWTVHDSAQLVVAHSPGLGGDCGAAVRKLSADLGGRGGGRPDLAQAGGIAPASVEKWSQDLVDYFRVRQSGTDGR